MKIFLLNTCEGLKPMYDEDYDEKKNSRSERPTRQIYVCLAISDFIESISLFSDVLGNT